MRGGREGAPEPEGMRRLGVPSPGRGRESGRGGGRGRDGNEQRERWKGREQDRRSKSE